MHEKLHYYGFVYVYNVGLPECNFVFPDEFLLNFQMIKGALQYVPSIQLDFQCHQSRQPCMASKTNCLGFI